jgi:hypothetical protein
MVERLMDLSFIQPITFSLSLLQRMASNDDNNNKHNMEEEVESTIARKRLRPSDDNGRDDDSSNSPEEETEEEAEVEEVSSEKMSMNQLNISEEKLFARRACSVLFGDDDDTPSTSS